MHAPTRSNPLEGKIRPLAGLVGLLPCSRFDCSDITREATSHRMPKPGCPAVKDAVSSRPAAMVFAAARVEASPRAPRPRSFATRWARDPRDGIENSEALESRIHWDGRLKKEIPWGGISRGAILQGGVRRGGVNWGCAPPTARPTWHSPMGRSPMWRNSKGRGPARRRPAGRNPAQRGPRGAK